MLKIPREVSIQLVHQPKGTNMNKLIVTIVLTVALSLTGCSQGKSKSIPVDIGTAVTVTR